MKRTMIVLGLAVGLLGLGALAVALARPDLLRPAPAARAERIGASADSGLYCREHGVPEAYCTLCHEELKDKLLLCPEHGNIPEDICTKCHPEVEKKHNIRMCPKGHGLPEHFCHECGNTAAAAGAPDDGWCAAHGKPEAQCVACAPGTEAGSACRQPLPLVRLRTATLAREIGIQTAEAEVQTHTHILEANAETAFDGNRYADVSPRVRGYLREVHADLGAVVEAGQVLAVVDSPEISALKSRLVSASAAHKLARASYERTKELAGRDALPAKQELEALTALNQAESAVLEASQALRNLGFGEEELARIAREKDVTSLLPVVSPIGGTVVQRHAVRGEAVQEATMLFAVADTSRLWLWIDVYEEDAGRVAVGQPVRFRLPGTDLPAAEGRVTWVGAAVDETTRTARVRAELTNPEGRLRANQFGRAEIQVGEPHEVVVVPKAAVQSKDGVQVVFLPQGDGVFRPQRVVTQASNRRDAVEVSWGLKPGDRVVTAGSFWLKTEIMKGAIGAGCCE